MLTFKIVQTLSSESVCIRKKIQKRLFWLSNLPDAVILNNCDVSWLPYCSDTKSVCSGTMGQPRNVTIIQDGAPGKFESQNKRFWN